MGDSLINNDLLRVVFLCLLVAEVPIFELGLCEWHSEQAAEPAQGARLQAGHRITSCSFLKDSSNSTEGGLLSNSKLLPGMKDIV